MNKTIFTVAALLILSTLACGTRSSQSEPRVPVATITIGDDLTKTDLCQAIPKEDIEAVMGRRLVSASKHFEYYDTAGSSGCWYDAGKDSDRGERPAPAPSKHGRWYSRTG